MISTKTRYFVTYAVRTPRMNDFRPLNTVIADYPLDWLMDCNIKYKPEQYILINWKEIDEKYYEKYKGSF